MGENSIFNFKINIKLIKIFLLITIIVFFLPFFSVSCSSQDKGVTFSGFELSTGKNIGNQSFGGSFLGFILIIFPVILLILSFFINKIKNNAAYNICKNIFFIAPVFDIFAVFIIRYAFKLIVKNKLSKIPVLINIKYGFVLYVILNIIIFILAAMNYFVKRE